MHVHSQARQVVLSAPYWVVNKTNLQIQVEDTTPNEGLSISAQPGLSDLAIAVPFRYESPPPYEADAWHACWPWDHTHRVVHR